MFRTLLAAAALATLPSLAAAAEPGYRLVEANDYLPD